ncbi:MAG: OmpA family protein [Gemmatimonadota bacterium]
MKHRAIATLILTVGLPTALLAQEENRVGFSVGAYPVVEPRTYGAGYDVFSMLDEDPASGWAGPKGDLGPHVMVLALPARTTLTALEFDIKSVDGAGRGAKGVTVEISDQSDSTGYRPVLRATLRDAADGHRFPVQASVPGRWLRLTIAGNQGDADYTELMGFRGFGSAEPAAALPDVSGAFETIYGLFHIKQQGSAVIGCYEHDGGLLEGTIEGRVMQLTWREEGGGADQGPAVMIFRPDGSSFRGLWWYVGGGKGTPQGRWDGTRKSSEVGTCPHWTGSVGGEMHRTLESSGRTRLYGILFDIDAATIRPESKAVLDEVAQVLSTEPAWKLLIEGHTDAQGSDPHNQELSDTRAQAVRAALIARGVDAARLRAVGFGESKPVADNATAMGRAQNRRVELVRE